MDGSTTKIKVVFLQEALASATIGKNSCQALISFERLEVMALVTRNEFIDDMPST